MSAGRFRKAITVAAVGLLSLHASAAPPVSQPPSSGEAAALFHWVVQSRDNEGLPFMIIDKKRAHLWVFDRAAHPQGDAPVLLGMARGDHTVPGVGDKELADIRPEDRTTPAGRFRAEIGLNARGEDVVWVDYDSGVSMHRVLTDKPAQRRAERLATPTPSDNRISYGCINVPKTFFETIVTATVNGGHSIVYILPESAPVRSVFGSLAVKSAGPGTSPQ